MLRLALTLALLLAAPQAQAGEASLWSREVQALRRLVRADPSARALVAKMKRLARRALRETPQPVAQIRTAGLLRSDPVKQRTRAALRDAPKVLALAVRHAMAGAPAHLAKAQEILLAWARTNRGAGNPIDDTNLEPLIEGYDVVRKRLPAEARAEIEGWLRQVARALIEKIDRRRKTAQNNWHSHRLKIIGLVGAATRDAELRRYAHDGLRKQIEVNLRADGSSFDFHHRDAVHYHVYDLAPLLRLAILLRRSDPDLYRWTSPSGSSLARSVAWLLPYARGEKTHAEFARSRSRFDAERAKAGEEGHRTGEPFRPERARLALELAEYFERGLRPLVAKLFGKEGVRFPCWRALVNAVTRRR